MAKRYTDSEKWDDPFFTELPNEYKLLWIYILDKCDHAGIYKVNPANAHFALKTTFDWEQVIKVLDGRIQVLNKDKWFIPKFISFQYGELDINNRVHNTVYKILEKEGVFKGRQRPVNKAQEKEQDKDKDKDKEKYGDFVLLTGVEHKNLVEQFGAEKVKNLIEIMNNGIAAKGYKYKSHYHALLNWEKREIEPKKTGQSQVSKNPKPKKDCDVCKGTGIIKQGEFNGQCFCVS